MIIKYNLYSLMFIFLLRSSSSASCRTTNDHKNHTCEGIRFKEIVLSRSTRLQLLRTRIYNCKELEILEGALIYPNLESLTISCGTINNINEKAFFNFNTLQELDLSYNKLSTISNTVFHPLGNLQTLNLTGNNFKDLPQLLFDGLSSLKELFLSYNKIENFHIKGFDKIKTLEKLCLDHNEISFLPARLLTKLRKLQYVDLSHNYIENIGDAFILSFNLQYLNLSHNLINDLPLRVFQTTRMEILDLSYNKLTIIYEDALQFKTLKELYLQNNEISLFEVSGMNMESLPLQLLDVERNRLVFLEEDFIKTAKNLKELYFLKNPWDCECLYKMQQISRMLFQQPKGDDTPLCVLVTSNGCNINKNNLTAYYEAFEKQLDL